MIYPIKEEINMDINMQIVENGVILRISKNDKEGNYKNETLVFSSLDEAQSWLKENAPDKKIEKGVIEETIEA